MKKIFVTYIPSEHKVTLWWSDAIRPGKLESAEWEEVKQPTCGWVGDRMVHVDTCNCDWNLDVQRDLELEL